MTLKLNPRSAEIASKIQRSVRSAVLNAVIARSVEEGLLQKELSYHLSTEELENVLEEIGGGVTIAKKRGRPKKSGAVAPASAKKPKEPLKDDDEELSYFIGFDD
jgi:hypothetical protein